MIVAKSYSWLSLLHPVGIGNITLISTTYFSDSNSNNNRMMNYGLPLIIQVVANNHTRHLDTLQLCFSFI